MLLLMSIPMIGFVICALLLLMGSLFLTLASCALFIILPVWILLSTGYLITGDALRVRFGPFRMRIAIDDIHAIEAVKSLHFGPALSMDKIKITYGEPEKVLYISPADKYMFVFDLGIGGEHRFSHIEQDDD